MGFDPHASKFTMTQRCKPLVLLLDTSGSMRGEKIERLYDAVTMMIHQLDHEKQREIVYKIAIITFGGKQASLHTTYTDVSHVMHLPHFEAGGGTPLGSALTMAKDMIENRDTTKSTWYRPTVILVSDGRPNTGYKKPMAAFIDGSGLYGEKPDRTQRCQRMAIGIGNAGDLNEALLQSFVSEPDLYFHAEDAADIAKKFELVTTTIRTTVRPQ